MASIKLYHPTVRPPVGAQFAVLVVETTLKYPVPYMCNICTKAEQRKSIHLRIGSDGYVFVSKEVFAALKPHLADAGLETHETVSEPPPLLLGAVELPKQQIVDRPLNTMKRLASFWHPGRTKYESRDIMQDGARRLIIPKLKLRRSKT